MTFTWTQNDEQAVRLAKVLAAEAVENAGSGHPGTAISLSGAAYLIYRDHLRLNPCDPYWIARDKFVLSAGHASLLQYIQLYFCGLGLKLDDLKQFRRLGSLTPGHPERDVKRGIQVTTGPLGSGFGAAVGMALAARRHQALLDPGQTSPGLFDYRVYVIAGDGCMQEGVTSEASSLAGTQELGNLIVIYDDNHISIEDDTSIAFGEDVLARYESYGWHTQRVNWLQDDGTYKEDYQAFDLALRKAKANTRQPSLIALRTIIGWPVKAKQNTASIHGSPIGAEALRELKLELGFDPDQSFTICEDIVNYTRNNFRENQRVHLGCWEEKFEQWKKDNPKSYLLLKRLKDNKLPKDLASKLPAFPRDKDISTRAASGKVINALAQSLPELWGGSADLASSNNTYIEGELSLFPPANSSKAYQGNLQGRNLHFGVREHAMGQIMNGIASLELTRIYGGTFFVFADYMRPAVRLASLMDLSTIYIWTHDSIGVGEDGPTHQPVEHLASYRAISNLAVVRPADANECAYCWLSILEQRHPCCLVLSRQNLPNPPRDGVRLAQAKNVKKGAYILRPEKASFESALSKNLILLASGSEVHLALKAAEELENDQINVRVVSVPCFEWFELQSTEYKLSVLPPTVKARVSVEAGIAQPWYKYLTDQGKAVSVESYGASGKASDLFTQKGITVEKVIEAAKETLDNANR